MKKVQNKEISCNAKNCVYHSGTDGCVAEKIHVEQPSACNSAQTSCSTFKNKNNTTC
ncbi:MAG: DUF1540 domain-containing protein [Clostridia bacterium]|nr:DUF1540 domain-containing protein [Clostridia bacterium]